jgi:hypothetical protein
VSSIHLRTETDPVSETLCFLDFRVPDDGQSPNNECYTPQSEPFRIYKKFLVKKLVGFEVLTGGYEEFYFLWYKTWFLAWLIFDPKDEGDMSL